MGNTAFKGGISIQKPDGTLVEFVDAEGNLQVSVDLAQIEDANGNEILEFDAVTSAVNHFRIANAATGNRPILSIESEADIGMEIHNDQGEEILILVPVATALNELTITNSATGNPVLLANNGQDDIGFEFHAKNGEEMLKLEATVAATTFVSIKSQSTGVNPEISAEGEADTGLTFMNDQSEEILILNSNATAVNEITISNAAAGSEPSVAATGGDTDIHIDMTPKGTGNVRATRGAFEEPVETVTTASPVLTIYGATQIDSTSNAVNGTLGSGTFVGQIKTIVMTNSSNSSTISITNHETSDPEIATFDAVDETGVFLWSGTEWITIFATCTFV